MEEGQKKFGLRGLGWSKKSWNPGFFRCFKNVSTGGVAVVHNSLFLKGVTFSGRLK
jgi:hypothetical protein